MIIILLAAESDAFGVGAITKLLKIDEPSGSASLAVISFYNEAA
jgi:hypothetical protein